MEENNIKNVEKGLKNASAVRLATPSVNLFAGEKMNPKKVIEMNKIYPCIFM